MEAMIAGALRRTSSVTQQSGGHDENSKLSPEKGKIAAMGWYLRDKLPKVPASRPLLATFLCVGLAMARQTYGL